MEIIDINRCKGLNDNIRCNNPIEKNDHCMIHRELCKPLYKSYKRYQAKALELFYSYEDSTKDMTLLKKVYYLLTDYSLFQQASNLRDKYRRIAYDVEFYDEGHDFQFIFLQEKMDQCENTLIRVFENLQQRNNIKPDIDESYTDRLSDDIETRVDIIKRDRIKRDIDNSQSLLNNYIRDANREKHEIVNRFINYLYKHRYQTKGKEFYKEQRICDILTIFKDIDIVLQNKKSYKYSKESNYNKHMGALACNVNILGYPHINATHISKKLYKSLFANTYILLLILSDQSENPFFLELLDIIDRLDMDDINNDVLNYSISINIDYRRISDRINNFWNDIYSINSIEFIISMANYYKNDKPVSSYQEMINLHDKFAFGDDKLMNISEMPHRIIRTIKRTDEKQDKYYKHIIRYDMIYRKLYIISN